MSRLRPPTKRRYLSGSDELNKTFGGLKGGDDSELPTSPPSRPSSALASSDRVHSPMASTSHLRPSSTHNKSLRVQPHSDPRTTVRKIEKKGLGPANNPYGRSGGYDSGLSSRASSPSSSRPSSSLASSGYEGSRTHSPITSAGRLRFQSASTDRKAPNPPASSIHNMSLRLQPSSIPRTAIKKGPKKDLRGLSSLTSSPSSSHTSRYGSVHSLSSAARHRLPTVSTERKATRAPLASHTHNMSLRAQPLSTPRTARKVEKKDFSTASKPPAVRRRDSFSVGVPPPPPSRLLPKNPDPSAPIWEQRGLPPPQMSAVKVRSARLLALDRDREEADARVDRVKGLRELRAYYRESTEQLREARLASIEWRRAESKARQEAVMARFRK